MRTKDNVVWSLGPSSRQMAEVFEGLKCERKQRIESFRISIYKHGTSDLHPNMCEHLVKW